MRPNQKANLERHRQNVRENPELLEKYQQRKKAENDAAKAKAKAKDLERE